MSDAEAFQYYSKLTIMPQVNNTQDLLHCWSFLSTSKNPIASVSLLPLWCYFMVTWDALPYHRMKDIMVGF